MSENQPASCQIPALIPLVSGFFHIYDATSLADFRRDHLSPAALMGALVRHDVAVINLPTGGGKSFAQDDLIDYHLERPEFDLIVGLAGQTNNLMERRRMKSPTPRTRYLKPRPKDDCGALNQMWINHEQRGTSAIAKESVCGQCPHRSTCKWPLQYSKTNLLGVELIFATQAHLKNNPRFIPHLKRVTGAKRVLLLIDEAAAISAPKRVSISTNDLHKFIIAVQTAHLTPETRNDLLQALFRLNQATTVDLKSRNLSLPSLGPWNLKPIQKAGLAKDADFECIGSELQQLAKSSRDERWRDQRGNIVFVARPTLGDKTVIFAAGMDPRYVARQLRIPVATISTPLGRYEIQHRDTTIFNINANLGAAKNVPGNLAQLVDFFALLLMRNWKAGRTTILICRKMHKELMQQHLNRRLSGWGTPIRVDIPDSTLPTSPSPPSPTVVPLIHYGVSGINSYEGYGAAYCLSSYNISESILDQCIRDVQDDDLRFPVTIRQDPITRKRVAATFNPDYAYSDADTIAKVYYHQHQTNVVIQAIGRVRYAIKPREIITFQASDLPGLKLSAEFTTLQQARDHFGIPTGSEYDRTGQTAAITRMRSEGFTTAEIARALSISERTIRNRLSSGNAHD